jgi:hypothetical protein
MVAEATVSELKSKYGDIHLIEVGELEFLARAPSVHEYNRLALAVQEGGQKQLYSYRELAMSCTVYPEREKVAALLDTDPSLSQLLAKPIVELSGINREVRVKKL